MHQSHFTHPSFLLGNYVPLPGASQFWNQFLLTTIITLVSASIIYYSISSLSYLVFFLMYRHKFTPDRDSKVKSKQQLWNDVKWSFLNILGQAPLVTLLKMSYPTHSKVFYNYDFSYKDIAYVFFHIVYDQFLTYWIHRLLHHPSVFRLLHQVHHRAKTATPFTGFAFHPFDAFLQALPALTSCFFVPLHIDFVIVYSLLTSVWAISIHDNVNLVPFKGFLYAGSHTIHHWPWGMNFNYGKFTSLCDIIFGTYCDPMQITGYGYKQPDFESLNRGMNKLIKSRKLQSESLRSQALRRKVD